MVVVLEKMTMIDTDEGVVDHLTRITMIEDTEDVGGDDGTETTTAMTGVAPLLKIIAEDAVGGVTGHSHLHKIGTETVEGDTGPGQDLDRDRLGTEETGDQTDVPVEIVTATTTLYLLFRTEGRFSFPQGLLLV